MRIRLQLLSPFKEAKLLLPLPDTIRTVTELKKHVRQSLSAVRDIAPSTKDILLEIDGFELLPGSLVKEVVEDKDVITVRLRAGTSKKRSASASVTASAVQDGSGREKRRKVDVDSGLALSVEGVIPVIGPINGNPARTVEKKPSPSSSSSASRSSSSSTSSSSSSSSSSPSSSSSSSSSSPSSSSSSSSSSDDSTPASPIIPPHLRPKGALGDTQSHTPPGQGKSGTQDRNRRRRRAYLLKKVEEGARKENVEGLKDNGNTTEAPEQEAVSTSKDVVSYTQSELPVPKSMANRNKKKGFMKEMNSVQGTKIVFGDDAEARSTPVAEQARLAEGQEGSIPALTPQHTGQTAAAKRVLPPSEMDLPTNVFVTHQVYDRRGWTPKGRSGRRQAEVVEEEEEVEQKEEEEQDMEVDEEDEEDAAPKIPVGLPNGGSDVFTATVTPAGIEDGDDWWTRAENRFDELPIIDTVSRPAKDTVIAWKELQLDTYSFTPQLKVQLGEVVEASGERLVLRRLERYDADEDDPFNGQPEELVVEMKVWQGSKENYRFIADPIKP